MVSVTIYRTMPRVERVDVGGEIYHVINRANTGVKIFNGEMVAGPIFYFNL
jgi:hypothetical protein